MRRALDLGITHFDLANNYGAPYGSAKANFGLLRQQDLRPFRDQLIASSKAGTTCGPGRTANGARAGICWQASHQSLQRIGLEYVDIF